MQDLPQFIATCSASAVAALFVVDLFLGLAVGADAKGRLDRGQPVACFGPGLWFVGNPMGSLLVLASYWVMHYSNLMHVQDFLGRARALPRHRTQ